MVLYMAELWLSDETPLCMASMQAHTIASDVSAPSWAVEVLEQMTTKLAKYTPGTIVTVSDSTIDTTLNALTELEDAVTCPYRRETIQITKSLVEKAQLYASHRPQP